MRTKAIIPLVVGLGVGILAIKMFADVLKKAKGAGTTDMVQVVCASTDIAPTMEIKESMIELKPVARSLVPKMAPTKKEEVVGRVASLPIPRGIPVVPNLLAPKGTQPGMAVRIKDGYRAVAVKVDEFAGVGGWLKPGSRVDVVAVFQPENTNSGKRGTVSKVILDNIEVLAVGQDLGAAGEVNPSVAKSVTLLVRPEDVPRLHLASTKGTIRLAMRNMRDYSVSGRAETTDKDLLDESDEAETGEKPGRKSLLARLFGAERKIDSHKTDKDTGTGQADRSQKEAEVPPPPVTPVVAAARPAPWRVEFMAGPQSQDVWFESDAKGARRLENQSGLSGVQERRPPQVAVVASPVADRTGMSGPEGHAFAESKVLTEPGE